MSESKRTGSQPTSFDFLKLNYSKTNNTRNLVSPANKKAIPAVDEDLENSNIDINFKIKKKSGQKNMKNEDNLSSTPKKMIETVHKEEISLKRKSEDNNYPEQRKILQEEKKDNCHLSEKKIGN